MSDLKVLAYNHIRNEMFSGHWPEGRYLSMVQVAKKIGMSYTPVREAIIQLESEGIVEKIPRVGVRPRRISRQELMESFEIRIFLESGAAELAAERIGESRIRKLREYLQEQRNVVQEMKRFTRQQADFQQARYFIDGPEAKRLVELNSLFHEGVIHSSGNEKMIKVIGDLHILTRVLRGRALMPGTNYLHQLARDYAFHYRILRALQKHDARKASDMMRNHMADAKKYHMVVYEWLDAMHGANETGMTSETSDVMESQMATDEETAQ